MPNIHFRELMLAASLKHDSRPDRRLCFCQFPRADARGLIEALPYYGVCALSGHAYFREQMFAASLKPIGANA